MKQILAPKPLIELGPIFIEQGPMGIPLAQPEISLIPFCPGAKKFCTVTIGLIVAVTAGLH
jgi:hypothetical protein